MKRNTEDGKEEKKHRKGQERKEKYVEYKNCVKNYNRKEKKNKINVKRIL